MVKPFPSKTHIGNHMLHPETLMMNYGYDPQLSEGAIKPPVFLTGRRLIGSGAAARTSATAGKGLGLPAVAQAVTKINGPMKKCRPRSGCPQKRDPAGRTRSERKVASRHRLFGGVRRTRHNYRVAQARNSRAPLRSSDAHSGNAAEAASFARRKRDLVRPVEGQRGRAGPTSVVETNDGPMCNADRPATFQGGARRQATAKLPHYFSP
jgi:hypothetical protein